MLLDGVVLGGLHVQFAQRRDPPTVAPGQFAEGRLQRFPVGGEGVHHVGQDRHRYFGPDGESNLRHPGGRVRPHRDGAGQHPVRRVQLEAAQVIGAQPAPGDLAQADSRRRKLRARRFAHGVDRGRGEHAARDGAVVGLARPATDVGRDHAGLVAAGVGVGHPGDVSRGPHPVGDLARGGGGQGPARRDADPELLQAEAADPGPPAGGQQQPVRVEARAVLQRERQAVVRAFGLGGRRAEEDLDAGPAQGRGQDFPGEGGLAGQQPRLRLDQRHL